MVEVMIATALVALIMTLAFPSFRGITLRAHRTGAISLLLQAAGCQERVRAAAGLYDTGKCLPAETDRYSYRFEPPNASATASYRIVAVPLKAQSADRCGALMLDHDGHRETGGVFADAGKCWVGR